MDPTKQFSHNPDCLQRGQIGRGNIGVHSEKDQRYICHACQTAFSATKGTPFFRLRTAADEVWVKMVGRKVWMALALAVPSRLWLGEVVSPHRDRALITSIVQMVRSCAVSLAILVASMGSPATS